MAAAMEVDDEVSSSTFEKSGGKKRFEVKKVLSSDSTVTIETIGNILIHHFGTLLCVRVFYFVTFWQSQSVCR